MVLDAHKALIELNDKNRNMFKNVVQLLQSKLDNTK
jgi:hypothetical protein